MTLFCRSLLQNPVRANHGIVKEADNQPWLLITIHQCTILPFLRFNINWTLENEQQKYGFYYLFKNGVTSFRSVHPPPCWCGEWNIAYYDYYPKGKARPMETICC